MDTHTDPSEQDAPPCSQHRAQPCSHCGGRSSGTKAAAQGTRQRHGRHQGTAWQGTSLGLAMQQLPHFLGNGLVPLPQLSWNVRWGTRGTTAPFSSLLRASRSRERSLNPRGSIRFSSQDHRVPQWPRNGLVTLRSCSVVFHFCPRGIMAILSSPAFPLHILSSPRKALVLCAPGGVDGSHPLFLGQKELCRAHRGDWQG